MVNARLFEEINYRIYQLIYLILLSLGRYTFSCTIERIRVDGNLCVLTCLRDLHVGLPTLANFLSAFVTNTHDRNISCFIPLIRDRGVFYAPQNLEKN